MYTNKDENTHAELARDSDCELDNECRTGMDYDAKLRQAEDKAINFIHDKESTNELLELLVNDDSIARKLVSFVRGRSVSSANEFISAVRTSVVSSYMEDI
jgi:hypothetical protein